MHRSLQRSLGLRVLATRPKARQALDALRTELGRSGLLRPPGRLRAARSLLACVPVTVGVGLLATEVTAPALLLGTVPVAAAALLLCVPPTTRAARRLLAGLRERHPLPAHRREVTDGKDVLLYVALYGDPALALFLPHFSRDGGCSAGAATGATATRPAAAGTRRTAPPARAAPRTDGTRSIRYHPVDAFFTPAGPY